MARNFTAASTHYLEYAGAVVGAVPLTMACWGRVTTLNAGNTLMAISRDSGGLNDSFALDCIDSATDSVRALTGVGGNSSAAATTTGITVGTWFHAGAVFAATNDRRAFINGGSKGTQTTSRIPTSLNRTALGRIPHFGGSAINYFTGDLAEAAIWDVALDDAEMAVLATGASPLLVRPGSLVGYWPVIGRYSPEIDVVGGFGMTVTGAVVADHPRIRLPRRRSVLGVAGEGGGEPAAGPFVPSLFANPDGSSPGVGRMPPPNTLGGGLLTSAPPFFITLDAKRTS